MNRATIRNFCIIAHIDHGKSTLADRLLQATGAVDSRTFREQLLDDMELERERGITIKASCVRLSYRAADGQRYLLNLIDTPGHVDFSFEVTKSLQACEGTVLVVDAAQGVEAQTVANYLLAKDRGLAIIPVINKIDLPNAQPERVAQELAHLLQRESLPITYASAKEGRGVPELLERIVHEVPAPSGDPAGPLSSLIFDSTYDAYKGVIVFVRVVEGTLRRGMSITLMSTQHRFEVQGLGVLTPRPEPVDVLTAGEAGYFSAGIRQPHDVVAGDTVTETARPVAVALPGFRRLKPMVFAGIYPASAQELAVLRTAMEKFALTDAAFQFEPEQSDALGQGFRCGFLGLLHMEIVQERLEREYGVTLVLTTPNVVFQVTTREGKPVEVHRPNDLPPPAEIASIAEPFVNAVILCPSEVVGSVMELAIQKRGVYRSTEYLSETRVKLVYELPLAEILVDFYDRLKSLTRGYGSFDYEFLGYRNATLVRLDILLNGRLCEPLSLILSKESAYEKGKALVERLKALIPRQLFEVVIQAAVGSHIIARDSVRPLAKHVTGKCYGGDITRKRKLWERQREGKRRMKQFGNVEIPQEAFLAVLKI
ncbi:MAG: translation elongation factor 4 [Candidatus Omnitrophota bacterium]|nr:translation elongation factor 4 [Candidatus Omnitrophota bacterium]